MSDDVCDSWEDMIENGVLDKKLEQMKLTNAEKSTSGGEESDAVTGMNNPQGGTSGSGIKILRRPPPSSILTNSSQTTNNTNTATNAAANSNTKTYDLNNFVNSQPFVPQYMAGGQSSHLQSQQPYPQITLEDNTRTQYVPQVKILKRPNNGRNGGGKYINGENGISPTKGGRSSTAGKTYEEREAEYARARLRILGSAIPSYPSTDDGDEVVSNNSCTNNGSSSSVKGYSPPQQSNPSYNSTRSGSVGAGGKPNGELQLSPSKNLVVRMPIGPDGTKGFNLSSR